MKYSIILILLMQFSFQANSQLNSENVKVYLKDYPKDDFVISESSKDIQYKYVGKSKSFVIEEAIKYHIIALKPYVTAKITLFYDDNSEITSASLSSGSMQKITGNYTPQGLFHSDLKICAFTIAFKNSGQEKTITIKRKHSDILHFSKVYFAEQEYPVIKSSITINTPDELSIDIRNFNTENYGFNKNQTASSKSEKTVNYTCEKIPIYHDESNLPPSAYYTPQLIIIPKTYHADNSNQTFFDGIPCLYAWYKQNSDQTENETQNLTNIVKKITDGKLTDLEKIKSIFYFVQDNIRYIAFEEGLAGYIPEKAQKVYDDKYGDCKGMANLLKTMLKIANYDARLTWIGTKDIRFDFSIPTIVSSNHMICTLVYNHKRYILDATDKYSSFGYCSEEIAGRPMLIENDKTFIIDTVPSIHYRQNKLVKNMTLELIDNNLSGTASLLLDGDFRTSALSKLHFSSTDNRQNILNTYIDKGSSKIITSNVSSSNIENRDSTFHVESNIKIKGMVNQFENDIFISLDPFDDISSFDVANSRKLPLFLPSRQCRTITSKFKIPEGYQLKSMPENFTLSNKTLLFTTKYTQSGKFIIYTKEIAIKANIIPQNEIEKWILDLKKIKIDLRQPLVISKI